MKHVNWSADHGWVVIRAGFERGCFDWSASFLASPVALYLWRRAGKNVGRRCGRLRVRGASAMAYSFWWGVSVVAFLSVCVQPVQRVTSLGRRTG